MILVTVEDHKGMWYGDPEAFDNEKEAEGYAHEVYCPIGYVAVLYECSVIKVVDRDIR